MAESGFQAEGGCACGAVRYRVTAKPLFVHCCHCRWCQRETGSAFVLNALVETGRVETLKGAPATIETPSESGSGQNIVRCPSCQIALWSDYAGMKDKISFIRVGTLDDPDLCPPDIHIFTGSKQAWVTPSPDKPVREGYYDWKIEWPPESRVRRLALRPPKSGDG